MDVRATRRGVPAAVLWGGIGVLAWATLTVLLGGGSAHADDQDDGPLDGLTSLVSETVSAVTAPVAPVVTEVVAPVVTQVVAPVQDTVPPVVAAVTQPVVAAPVVGPAVAPVAQTVSEATAAVVAPVAEAITNAPVAQITDPILDTVSGLPVVGDLVSDLGITSAVGDLVGVIDDTTALLGDVTTETVPPVLEALVPTTPGDGDPGGVTEPAEPLPDTVVAASVTTTSARATGAAETSPGILDRREVGTPPAAVTLGVDGTTHAVDDTTPVPSGPPSGNPPGAPSPASSSAGSGGGAGAAHARPSDVDASPLRAGERTTGAPDDVLPSSPVADTDVSPD